MLADDKIDETVKGSGEWSVEHSSSTSALEFVETEGMREPKLKEILSLNDKTRITDKKNCSRLIAHPS